MFRCLPLVLTLGFAISVAAQSSDTSRGDQMLANYFRTQTEQLESSCLADFSTDSWETSRDALREQLLEMLGLSPMPSRTDLRVTVTQEVAHQDVVVKSLHFQSSPRLYVTANLYMPKKIEEPLPAILYVCGHGRVRIDGVDFGSKVNYQHHPAWFAQNGYVCLIIDTLQLGEIEGIHHGTYREDMWWWLNRGYTPAGVEAWNCIRALDFLQSLPEVDGQRIGVTGRSGGGAYSWWIAAIDDRIKCAVPVAGITDLQDHVVNGCVEGHCDCMYFVNTYKWDYPLVAALMAPRPLLISNTDNDSIFPLEGVYRTYKKVKRVYDAIGASDQVALHITAGPHKDTQELRVHAFRWLNRHLKNDMDSLVLPASKLFEPADLKVFDQLPADQQNQKIHEVFVSRPTFNVPESPPKWEEQYAQWMKSLEAKVFGGWPRPANSPTTEKKFAATVDGLSLEWIEFESQPNVLLPLLVADASPENPDGIELHILDENGWNELLSTLAPAFAHRIHDPLPPGNSELFQTWARQLRTSNTIRAYLPPRGIGPTKWDQSRRKQIQHRRRFYLLGQTRDGMRAYDVRRATAVLERLDLPVSVHARGTMAGIGLYASLFEPRISQLHLEELPSSHRAGPIFLNVNRFLDVPQAVAMAVATKNVTLRNSNGFEYSRGVARLIGRTHSLTLAAD